LIGQAALPDFSRQFLNSSRQSSSPDPDNLNDLVTELQLRTVEVSVKGRD